MNEASPRPSLSGGMIAVGILLILWGLLLGCGGACGTVGLVAARSVEIQGAGPEVDLLRENGLFFALTTVELLARLVLGVLAVAGGAGLLLRAPWSITAGYLFCAGTILASVFSMVVFFIWLLPLQLEAAEQASGQMRLQLQVQPFAQTGGLFCCGMLLPLGLFFFLRSDHVAEQVGDFEDDDDQVGEVFE